MLITRSSAVVFAACFAGSFVSVSHAQTLGAAFAVDYSLKDLGSVADVPANYGGMAIKPGDSNTLLIAGGANGSTGAVYRVGLTRDSNNHITGFVGPAVRHGDAAYNDGGAVYAPNGTFLYTKYPFNQLGQWKSGTTSDALVTDLNALGVVGSVGGVMIVPEGQPGAGRLKILSYGSGNWFDATFTIGSDGLYIVTGATLKSALAGTGPESTVYVPQCSPGFSGASVLVCEYGQNRVSAYRVNDEGDPNPASRRDFVVGLSGAEGSFIDPVTGDFIFGTFSGGNHLIRVIGFPSDNRCKADLNKDCFLNGDDYDAFVLLFEAGDTGSDYNDDGFVTGDDFDLFVNDFVNGC